MSKSINLLIIANSQMFFLFFSKISEIVISNEKNYFNFILKSNYSLKKIIQKHNINS